MITDEELAQIKADFEVEDSPEGGSLFEKSFEIIKESMSTVKQEILMTLEDGSNHIVYVTDISINGKEVSVSFSTPSEDRKAEIEPHVLKCVKIQIEEELKRFKKKKFWR